MRISSWFVLLLVAAANLTVWAWMGEPVQGTAWTRPMQGIAYNPSGLRQAPADGPDMVAAEIDRDLDLIDRRFDRVRTYSTNDDLDLVPYLARRHGLDVTLGAWLDGVDSRDAPEIDRLIAATEDNSNVTAVVVGNETLLRGDLDAAGLKLWLDKVRAEVDVPVATAETWHIWLDHPELADSVDFLAVHILPYWEGVPIDNAIAFIDEQYGRLQQAFPGKRIVLTEVGWPSDGIVIGDAVPSPANQALFLRSFVAYAERTGIPYYLLEAFDQPWKVAAEGTAGGYWGIWDEARAPKFSWSEEVSDLPTWPVLALLSTLLGGLAALAFLYRNAMSLGGRIAFAGLIQASAGLAVWGSHVALARYLTTWSAAGWLAIGVGVALLIVVLLVEAFEWCDVRAQPRLHRAFGALSFGSRPQRRVSIHVPLHNEPPDMVADTLTALSRLDYDNFEVLVIDNNTKDPAVWRPVEAFCAHLGERFRFIHIDHCPGFKAGALNRGLAITDPTAEIVAVIDSDYMVAPNWLADLVPHFDRDEVAFVQAPQDYRDGGESLFKRMCFWEYAGFFRIGMVQRNERNAVIQHGTMTMVRRTVLEDIGGWSEWCIAEDAELGLRLYEAGWDSVYVPASYGRGVTPDDFAAYKGQRFRWAYGSVQIVKKHLAALFRPGVTRLTGAQRYQFLAGWLPWFADGLNVLCSVLGLVWTFQAIFFAKVFDFPFIAAIALAILLFAFKVAKTVMLYRARVDCTLGEVLGASVAGLALSYTVAKAIFLGIVTSGRPFLRTPKCENQPALVRALVAVREEAVFMALLLGGSVGMLVVHADDGIVPILWAAFLAVQALPFGAAIVLSVIATLPARRRAVSVTRPAGEEAQRA